MEELENAVILLAKATASWVQVDICKPVPLEGLEVFVVLQHPIRVPAQRVYEDMNTAHVPVVRPQHRQGLLAQCRLSAERWDCNWNVRVAVFL